MILLTRTCLECGEVKNISCDVAAVKRWQEGQNIQTAMPEVSEDDRELLISGICGKCFDALFADDEEDEEPNEEEIEP
jgi:hypothetical protein